MMQASSTIGIAICMVALKASCSLAVEPTERQVTFPGAGGATLAGTLLLPAEKAREKFPGVVLVAGSGPTDRNGNQPPALTTDLLKQIAGGLAKVGVASLRYDKRGMYANAAELPKDKAQMGDFFTWEAFVGDVSAAAQFLGKQPEIRAGRIGIIGHSEGGLLALAAAAELKMQNQSPAALVLLSTPGRLPEAYITEQLQRLLKIQGATAEQTKYFLDENARITKSINEAGQVPADVPPGLMALYPAYLSKFLHSEFALDPAKSAAAFRGPVLVIAGEKDVQVSAERDAPALDAALKTRQNDDHELIVVPDASHNLKPVKTDEEPGFAGNVAAGVLDKLGTWLTGKLGAP